MATYMVDFEDMFVVCMELKLELELSVDAPASFANEQQANDPKRKEIFFISGGEEQCYVVFFCR